MVSPRRIGCRRAFITARVPTISASSFARGIFLFADELKMRDSRAAMLVAIPCAAFRYGRRVTLPAAGRSDSRFISAMMFTRPRMPDMAAAAVR